MMEYAMITDTRNDGLERMIDSVVREIPVLDMHTHLFDADFGDLLHWGIDELLTYHYLIAEVFRAAPQPYNRFMAMSKREQADHVWKHLFIERSPISEACRGVVSCLKELGLDPSDRNLNGYREFFTGMKVPDYIDLVFRTANVRRVVMTNDPFDDLERPVWDRKTSRDPRFQAAIRLDRLLLDWNEACDSLRSWGYDVERGLGLFTLREIRRFLTDWSRRIEPAYMTASLPPSFRFPNASPSGMIMERCVLPVGRELGLPLALMIGVKRRVNRALGMAGDSVGRADISAVEELCSRFPENRFLVTMLSRENQHELCVTARKFSNLMVFGCWWFLNNPSIIDAMTHERLELLGLSMIPQHSDARVLDQLLYKWSHSREVIVRVLTEKYGYISKAGWKVTGEDIRRDVSLLFSENFERFIAR